MNLLCIDSQQIQKHQIHRIFNYRDASKNEKYAARIQKSAARIQAGYVCFQSIAFFAYNRMNTEFYGSVLLFGQFMRSGGMSWAYTMFAYGRQK